MESETSCHPLTVSENARREAEDRQAEEDFFTLLFSNDRESQKKLAELRSAVFID